MQYTLRRIPPALDQAIRNRARAERKSLNEVAVEAITEALGVGDRAVVRRDLSDILRTWKRDTAFDAAIAEQDRIDESLWR